jgi:hypothetical protein
VNSDGGRAATPTRVIENLSRERNKRRFKPLVKRRIREFFTVSHLDDDS